MHGRVPRSVGLLSAALVAVQVYTDGGYRSARPTWNTAAFCHAKTAVHRSHQQGSPSFEQTSLITRQGCPDAKTLNVSTGQDLYTPLHVAAALGSLDEATALIASGANVNASDAAGTTPLMIAASLGDRKMCHLLVKAKASVDATAADGSTALHVAAYHGQLDVVNDLLAAGADIHSTRPDGINLMLIAIREGHRDLVLTLLQFWQVTEHHVQIAASWGHEGLVADLVAATSQLVGLPALEAAIERGHLGAVKAILQALSNTHQDILNGALLHTARTGQVATLNLLVDEGADIAATDERGNTAIHLAARHNHIDVILHLLHHHPNDLIKFLASPNFDGEFPVHLAAAGGHVAMLRQLETLGQSLKERSLSKGLTPVHVAAANGHLDTVKFLHTAECNLHQESDYLFGATPILLATLNGHDHVAEYIKCNGGH